MDIMNVTDSLPNNIQHDDNIKVPWDISSEYDDDKGKTIMNLIGINTLQEDFEMSHDTGELELSQ